MTSHDEIGAEELRRAAALDAALDATFSALGQPAVGEGNLQDAVNAYADGRQFANLRVERIIIDIKAVVRAAHSRRGDRSIKAEVARPSIHEVLPRVVTWVITRYYAAPRCQSVLLPAPSGRSPRLDRAVGMLAEYERAMTAFGHALARYGEASATAGQIAAESAFLKAARAANRAERAELRSAVQAEVRALLARDTQAAIIISAIESMVTDAVRHHGSPDDSDAIQADALVWTLEVLLAA
jgi:hypothetical protein